MDGDSQNPKLSYLECEFDTHFKVFHELMANKVLEILLVASAYDAYILEEDGSLASKIINEYRGLNLSRPPRLTWESNARKALELLKQKEFDLVVAMPNLDDMDPFELGLAVKQQKPDLPVILLAHSEQGLYPTPKGKDCSGIDQIFIWSGDSDLLLAIVKSVEDRLNVDPDTRNAQVRVIILVEDSPLYRSYFLPLIYREVVRQTQEVLEESLNEEHRLLKMRARPKILVAATYQEAEALYERYQPYLFGVLSDTRFPDGNNLSPDAGYRYLSMIRKQIPDLPLLLLSSESANRKRAEQIPAVFLDKNSPDLMVELHQFFLDWLGFGAFVFRMPDGTEVARASTLRELEKIIPEIPDEPFVYHAQRNRFSNWIMARSEIVLASRLRQAKASDFKDVAAMRRFIIDGIHALRKWRQKGVVAQFSRREFDPEISDFMKIGKGSLGGKARGLAFVGSLLRQSPQLVSKFSGIDIKVPQTLVITTDGFDDFVQSNELEHLAHSDLPDEQITEAFVRGRMPDHILGDLRAFIEKIDYPLSVRSSGLLEDAHHLPLAGLYKTFMIPNNHPDLEVRLEHLVVAIKHVYASTWYQEPRKYSRFTAYRHRKEQMAVIIQQVAGRRYGDFFYPAVSGVARSQNFYPIERIQPEDGVVQVALGFGTVISEGEAGLRFCPKYPRLLPHFSSVEDILAHAQRHFYALRMEGYPEDLYFERGLNIERRQISDALDEPAVQKLVSTYVPAENRIRDTSQMEGPKLVTFAPLLKHGTFPLAEIVDDLLAIGRKGMGCHLEFEFSIEFSQESGTADEFYILQMRPMAMGQDPFEVEITTAQIQKAFCYSTQALGHGKNDRIEDLIYVIPETFKPEATVEIAAQLHQLNRRLKSDNKPYLLVGPGRWGTFDRWLGIPVKWDDIDTVGAFVEWRTSRLLADPSQGSHFFQYITTQGLPYLTVSEGSDDFIRWEMLEHFEPLHQTAFLRHIRLPRPLLIKCDGRKSEAVILLPD